MQQRKLGNTDLLVSEIGLGCWQLGNDFGPLEEAQASEILTTSQQQNVNFLDTADVYGGGLSEERIGKWLKTLESPPIVATKLGRNSELYPDDYTKSNVRRSIEGSLQRLGVEALDLVQLHCIPEQVLFDGEIINWLQDFQQQGLIKHIGASVETMAEAKFCCQHQAISTIQIIFNLFRQDATSEVLPLAEQHNTGVIVRLPLASGLLTGKFTKQSQFAPTDHRNYNKDGEAFHVGETFNGIPFEQGLKLIEELRQLLPNDQKLLDLAIRWILDHPQVSTVICGVSSSEQLINNVKSSNTTPLTHSKYEELSNFYKTHVQQHLRGKR